MKYKEVLSYVLFHSCGDSRRSLHLQPTRVVASPRVLAAVYGVAGRVGYNSTKASR